MNNILLVAAREFRQIAGMRSFWLTLVIMPLSIVIGALVPQMIQKDEPDRVMVIDRTGGGEAHALEQRLKLDEGRDQLADLSRYVQRHHLERADPSAPWTQHDRWYNDVDVAAFNAAGGVDAAKAKIGRVKAKETPEFKAAHSKYEVVTVPLSIQSAPDDSLDNALKPILKPEGKDAKSVDYVILIPKSFGQSPLVRLWANRQPSQTFVSTVQDVLTKDLRTRFLASQGVSAVVAQSASTIAPALAISTPPPGGGAREAMLVRSILPLAAAYLLMISLMLSGSWMLQGTVEERSNKLLETVLACVSPEELMYGKLLGTAGVGLFMIAVWIGCGVFAAYATQGAISDFIRPALDPLTSPGTIIAMIWFFVFGYVEVAVLFLAIGADERFDARRAGLSHAGDPAHHHADFDFDAVGTRRKHRRHAPGGSYVGTAVDPVRSACTARFGNPDVGSDRHRHRCWRCSLRSSWFCLRACSAQACWRRDRSRALER